MSRLTAATATRILLVDGHRTAATALALRLATAGHRVGRAYSWREGLSRAVGSDHHLILLHRDLPEIDGLALVRILRACGLTAPMLLLSATDGAEARREALGAGADDHLAQPFADETLLARVAALARPPPQRDAPTLLAVADLELDLENRSAARAGRALRVPGRDFDLLAYLVRNHGRAVTRDSLLRHVWGRDPGPRTLRASIDRIRTEVDGGSPLQLIHVVPGIGYCLLDEGD
ncbi:response regulator transcription factor [Phenylobacterium hankyongense]|nr:response regulator transcription factor [Phenylobacterium hankyongense]